MRRRTEREYRQDTGLLTLPRVPGVFPLALFLALVLGLVLVAPSGGVELGLPLLGAAPISAAGVRLSKLLSHEIGADSIIVIQVTDLAPI